MNTPPAEKALKLEGLWSELIAKSPSKDNLAEVVRLVPELRERAWEAYGATNPTSAELFALIESWRLFDGSLVHYPALLLIEKYGDQNTLLYLLENILGVRIPIAEKLLANDCDEEMFVRVLSRIKEDPTLRARVADKLLNENRSRDEGTLGAIMRCAPERAHAAGRLLLEKEFLSEGAQLTLCAYAPSLAPELMTRFKDTLSPGVLTSVMYTDTACTGEAAEMLLQKSTQFNELFHVFRLCSHLREQAWRKLSVLELHPNQAMLIAKVAPEYTDRAKALVKVPPRTADTVLSEILTVRLSS